MIDLNQLWHNEEGGNRCQLQLILRLGHSWALIEVVNQSDNNEKYVSLHHLANLRTMKNPINEFGS